MVQYDCRWLVTFIIRLTNYKIKTTFINSLCSQSKPPTTISHKPRYIMQTPPHGVTIVHDTVVFFFMSIHMNDCSCVHSCVASVELSMVRIYNIYISTYRTSLSVYNIFHMMSTLTASYVASICDTTNNAMCNNGGYSNVYDI